MIGGLGENVADAATTGAFLSCHFVPDGFGAVLAVGGGELGAATGEGKGAGRGEVDMLEAVGDTIGGAVVTASNADSEAESCGVLEESVVGGKGLLAPGRFRAAPTDGDDRGVVFCVMNGGSMAL